MEKIPFDQEAFKNGAVALDEYNNEVIYMGGIAEVSMVHKVMKWGDGEIHPSNRNNLFNYVLAFYDDQWSMKPRLAATDLDEKICQAIADNYFKRPAYPACKGANCGCTDGKGHSTECYAEHNKAAGASQDDGASLTSAYYPMTDDETPQQALTRHAWSRYEAAHPLPQVVPPIADIENRIFAALCESLKEEKK